MPSHGGAQALGNLLAVLVVLSVVVYGLESCGVRTGVPQLLVCQVGNSLMTELGPGLLQLLIVGGVLLLILPWTRPWGTTLLVFGVGGMMVMGVWAQHAGTYCGSSTPGAGFTP